MYHEHLFVFKKPRGPFGSIVSDSFHFGREHTSLKLWLQLTMAKEQLLDTFHLELLVDPSLTSGGEKGELKSYISETNF